MPKSTKIILSSALLLSVLAAATLYYSSSVFLQLFIAFALAYVMNPAVEFFERHGISRLFAILMVFCLTILLCGGFALFLVISIAGEFSRVQLNLPAYVQHLYEITPAAIKGYLGIATADKLTLQLNDLLQQARNAAPDLLKPLLAFVRQALSSTVGVLLAVLGPVILWQGHGFLWALCGFFIMDCSPR